MLLPMAMSGEAEPQSKQENSDIEMTSDLIKQRFILAYATQTGQSKAIAEDMSDFAKSRGINIDVHCLSTHGKEFNIENENYMLFVTSTTGDGDPPDTAIKFLRTLKKKTEKFDDFSYALLDVKFSQEAFTSGLGDTNYTNFCNFGKTLDKRLKEMGAQPFYPSVWADDVVGLETFVDEWKNGVIEKLLEIFGKNRYSATESMENNTSSQSSSVTTLVTATAGLTIDSFTAPLSEVASIPANVVPSSPSVSSQPSVLTSPKNIQNIDKEVESQPIEDDMFQLAGYKIPLMTNVSFQLPSNPVRFLEIFPDPCTVFSYENQEPSYPPHYMETNHFFLPSARTSIGLASISNVVNFTDGEDVKKIIKLDLDISECGWTEDIEPGEAIGLICPNNQLEVEELLSRVGIVESEKFCRANFEVIDKVVAAKKKIIVLDKCSVFDLLMWHVDIRGVPKKAFLRGLAEVTSNERERRVLEFLSSRQGGEVYIKIFIENRFQILQLLKCLPSCKPSLGFLYENLMKLLPRPYSICSIQPDNISVVFSVSEYNVASCNIPSNEENIIKDNCGFTRQGLCTGWLCERCQKMSNAYSRKVAIYLRNKTSFRLPEDLSIPLIMIGPGTGVSPFIGFLQHRLNQMNSLRNSEQVFGETWLFFGCRGEKDFIFREEMEDLKSKGVLNNLQVCFSRKIDSAHPRYVQDGMMLHADSLSSLIIHRKAMVYICGDANKMAADVNSALKKILLNHSGWEPTDVDIFLTKLRTEKRIIEDVWI